MAATNPKVVLREQQPSRQASQLCKAPQINDPYRLLHMVESLPMLSQGVVDALGEGESYETIQRMIEVLHHSLEEISQQAKGIRR